MVIHLKKQYGYDSKDITEKITEGTKADKSTAVFDVEIAEEESGSEEDEAPAENEHDDDGEGGGGDQYKKKEKKEKKMSQAIIEKFKIEREKLPYMVITKKG